MPRDSNGVFTLVDGYLAVTGETIQPSQHNPPLEDIATALTGSLPRNGSAPMLAPLRNLDGSAAAPSITFNAATGTGFYRLPNGIGIAVGGQPVAGITENGFIGLPVGTPIPVMTNTLPAQCLWADGRNVSRTTYSALFAIFQGLYGIGDGTTTFGIPDLRGRAIVGRDNIGGTDAGRLAGAAIIYGDRLTTSSALGLGTNTLAIAHLPPHNHPGGTTDVQGLHSHQYSQNPTISNFGGGPSFSGGPQQGDGVTAPAGAHGHNVFLPSQGSSTPLNNVQPSLICNWAIYAGA